MLTNRWLLPNNFFVKGKRDEVLKRRSLFKALLKTVVQIFACFKIFCLPLFQNFGGFKTEQNQNLKWKDLQLLKNLDHTMNVKCTWRGFMSFVFLNNIKRWIICWFYKGQSFWSLYHHELFILNLITVTKAFIISSFPCIFKIKIVTLFTLYLLATFWFLFWNVYSNEK